MFHLKIISIIAFVATIANGCNFDQAEIEKVGMECVAAHTDPGFMLAVAEHMNNPDDMAKPTFICNYQKELVKIVECMKDKFEKCVPEQYRSLLELMSEKRLAEGLKFMCDHKQILEDKCMDAHAQDFIQCYMGKIAQLQSMVTMTPNPKGLVCSVIRSEEQCLRENKGSCSKQFIDIVIQMIEKFFPMSSCQSSKDALANTVLGSLLIHGQPQSSLKFKPSVIKY